MLCALLVPAIATAALLLTASAASADSITMYDLSGVTLSAADVQSGNGGTLTGSFTVDYTTSTITTMSLTASDGAGISTFTYVTAHTTAIDGLATMYFQSDANTGYQLRLYFPQATANPLPSGTNILTGGFSYDYQPTSGIGSSRFITAGSVVIDSGSGSPQPNGAVATPLPAAASMTLPLFAGLALWKSRKKTVAARI